MPQEEGARSCPHPSVPGKRARAAFCPGAFKRQLLVAGLEGRSVSLWSQQLQVARRLCQAHVQCPLGASAQGARFRTRGCRPSTSGAVTEAVEKLACGVYFLIYLSHFFCV